MIFLRFYFIGLILLLSSYGSTRENHLSEVGQWMRFEVQIENPSWKGNPFDVLLEASFTSPSGREINCFGFYAGENNWRIYFMPDEIGKWTYQTHSPDIDLDGKSGNFTCKASGLDSPLSASGKQWRLKTGGGDFPVIWNPPLPEGKHWGFRGKSLSDPEIMKAIQFADKNVGARLLGFGELLIAPIDWAKDWPQDAVPYTKGKEGDEFYLPFWEQLNAKLDVARDHNMGAYIMLYSDDALTPDYFGITAHSAKELRFFRYVIARLACYPHILWDTGIDIGEYRNNDWINWFANWFLANDPWQHPVGSRSGGGSGGIMPQKGTYFSTGGASLPSRSLLLDIYSKSNVPVAQTDHWRPFIERGDWTNTKIRIATWRCGLSGAQALFPDYNQGVVHFDQAQLAGREIGFATNFFRNMLRFNLLDLQPSDDLLIAGDNAILAANTGKEYVVYDEDGGILTIDLSGTRQALRVDWYNPRNGETVPAGKIKGGKTHVFTSPTKGYDWVLHIFRK